MGCTWMNSKKGVTSLFLTGPLVAEELTGKSPARGRETQLGRHGQNGALAAGMVWRGSI